MKEKFLDVITWLTLAVAAVWLWPIWAAFRCVKVSMSLRDFKRFLDQVVWMIIDIE